MTADDLVLAILGEAAAARVSLSKTKLLKLVYLADIEMFRRTGRTASGWKWRFLHFGPWAPEYDQCLERLAATNKVTVTTLHGDRDTQLVGSLLREFDVSTLDESAVRMSVRGVVNRWVGVDLREILDYVYFDTEPMREVERGSDLNFGTVPQGEVTPYKRLESPGGATKVHAIRRQLNIGSRPSVVRENRAPYINFTAPKYDDAALQLLQTLEDD